MLYKSIKLAHKVKLSSMSDAEAYKLKMQYDSCFQSLIDSCQYREINSSSIIPVSLFNEIKTNLENFFSSTFDYYVKRLNVFLDIYDIYIFELDEVKIKLKSFDIQSKQMELDIICISTELVLVDTIGSYVLVKRKKEDAEVITVELTNITTIFQINSID